MPDVLEAAGPREVDGRVLAVVVEALEPPDVTDLGVGDDDPGESPWHLEKQRLLDLLTDMTSSLDLIRLSMT